MLALNENDVAMPKEDTGYDFLIRRLVSKEAHTAPPGASLYRAFAVNGLEWNHLLDSPPIYNRTQMETFTIEAFNKAMDFVDSKKEVPDVVEK